MKILSEDLFNNEWVKFVGVLQGAGIIQFFPEEKLNSLYNGMKGAPAGKNEDSGVGYPGALLMHINLTTGLAMRLARMISGTFEIDMTSLLKVCALHQLSKIELFVPNDAEWDIRKNGNNFKFNNRLEGYIKTGERSAYNALRAGIDLTPLEYEAMKVIDKDASQPSSPKYEDNVLALLLKQANELAYLLEKRRWEKEREYEERKKIGKYGS